MTDIEARLRAAAPPPLDLAQVAAAEGLLDVAVASVDTPVGALVVAATPTGLVRTSWFAEEATLEELAARVSPRILVAPAKLDLVRRQLDEYFAGRRRRFDVAIDWRLVRGFGRDVLSVAARIPFGEARTYREVAAATGRPKAARAAGTALGRNPVPVVVPCHRVTRAGGAIGSYTGGPHIKEHLLRLEGFLRD